MQASRTVRSCPRCTFPLDEFTHEGVELDHCRRCGGTFLDPGEASFILGSAAEPQSWRDDWNANSGGQSSLRCPDGHMRLEIHRVKYGANEVEVDICPKCHGLWLDKQEGTKLYNIVAASRHAAQQKELGVDRPGVGSYIFQILTGFPMEVWNPVKHKPVVTYTIFGLLIAAYIFELMLMGVMGEGVFRLLALVPANPMPWSFLTYGLLHGSIMHIVGNLYFLWVFGDNVEDALGPKRFIILYLAANVAGGVLHFLANLGSEIPMLGASGAVSGLMGAYLVLFPRVKMWIMFIVIRLRVGIVWYLGFWLGYQVLMAAAGVQSVAWFAHLGGFAAGAGLAFLYRNSLRINVKRPV
jgi:membrane associated rhomboid family serine protease/Zn-finger nucleic acid-binding protein